MTDTTTNNNAFTVEPSLLNKSFEQDPIFSYITTLPPEGLDLLYQNEWACRAVFRSLSSLAQQYVTRLLFVDEAVPMYQITATTVNTNLHHIALDNLVALR
eukprot:GEZU01042867.1.p1 GENE.GEZU01042867.1~~GEZU01042867.1.p1  ORF type:complete len:101 (-),score=6.45 GEZU01042867.1:6-308(-)